MIAVATVSFWFAALLLFHVFVGYPLCVCWLASALPRRVRKEVATPTMTMPTVTVVIAAYEAGAHIRAKLMNVFAIAAASGDVLLMTDVRQNLDPVALRELVANLADPAVGAVSGELRLLDALTGFARGVDAYWRYEKLIRHAESRSGSTVGVTGALYAMRRELFRPLPVGTVLDDVLIPMRIAAAGRRVVFEPLALAWDRPSQHPAEERRRKIRTLAGNYQLVQLAPWLLLPWSNPLWWRFVSHKLLRLLAPWLLLLLALASAVLATRHALYVLPLLSLVGGFGLVVLGRRLPAAGQLWPVRLVVAFWYLNLFAAQALIAFARNRRLHLW